MQVERGRRKAEVERRKEKNGFRLAAAQPHSFALPPSHFRLAYTLVEMLLVLAVIGTLAAVAWPSVLRMQADHDLSAAAEHVRQPLATARTWAIRTGVAFQFRFEPNGRNFVVVPQDAEPESPTNSPQGNSSSPNTASAQFRHAGELPATASFRSISAASNPLMSGQKLPESALKGLPNAGALSGIGWSDPLVFAADGTAQDIVLAIGDRRGHRIDITIRGLTGAASVGPMYREANQ
jgi:prepilin-type N-terminal cleavage/methylation domain-containing protein